MKNIILLTVFAVGLSACATPSPKKDASTSEQGLVGPVWVLKKIGDREPIGTQALSFRLTPSGAIDGASGCGGYFGLWRSDRPDAPVLVVGTNKEVADCPSDIAAQEQRYVKLLELTATYQVTGNQLTMTTSTGTPLIFNKPMSN